MTTESRALIELLAKYSAKRGDFTLASGRRSDFYIDARLTTMSPEGLSLIGPTALEAMKTANWTPTAVGGLTLGADPIAYAISYASASTDRPLRAFTVRKEAKTHGTAKLVEGPFRSGDRVVIIEDVITTGSSALQAVKAVQDAGGIPLGVLALVDREEGGRDTIQSAGLDVVSLTTRAQIMYAMSSGLG
jgi:orotate phosphoribosyltransferase